MTCPPDWLSSFADDVTSCIRSHDDLAPLGCHFHDMDGIWEITLFASLTEVIGGPHDGRLRPSPFSVDVKPLLAAFSHVDKVTWQALRVDPSDELGPHLSIEGLVGTKPVWLRITSIAPERFEPGRHRLANQQAFKDIW
ncbi:MULTISPECIES: hypothetical protein [unclassified Schlesneria]|uniref:hypothetical protein n=1 Tax=Schlesneria TaxID=656899 RepID=UPI0035A0B1C8